MFLRGGLEFYIFKINHLPWFCILDFCLGRHRTFWLAQERLYDATAHLFVHSAGVMIFLTKQQMPVIISEVCWYCFLPAFSYKYQPECGTGFGKFCCKLCLLKFGFGKETKRRLFLQNRHADLKGNCINFCTILFKAKFLVPKTVRI